jgi:hypothetical protein
MIRDSGHGNTFENDFENTFGNTFEHGHELARTGTEPDDEMGRSNR